MKPTRKSENQAGERGLWRAVLIMVLNDYFHKGDESDKSARLISGYPYKNWANWFDKICEYAGYDGDWVRLRVKRIEKANISPSHMPYIGRYILGEWWTE